MECRDGRHPVFPIGGDHYRRCLMIKRIVLKKRTDKCGGRSTCCH